MSCGPGHIAKAHSVKTKKQMKARADGEELNFSRSTAGSGAGSAEAGNPSLGCVGSTGSSGSGRPGGRGWIGAGAFPTLYHTRPLWSDGIPYAPPGLSPLHTHLPWEKPRPMGSVSLTFLGMD